MTQDYINIAMIFALIGVMAYTFVKNMGIGKEETHSYSCGNADTNLNESNFQSIKSDLIHSDITDLIEI